ncbi:hypothetical protein B0H15DRAFT_943559 [Mycena belliarum]|uniref:Uncharacterized protein n=1 Tax=Mycena belliarum TaxID=1033014 RepID=A0AAD6ULV9_9AGAR|nr:hypothetical protein B0H15DRAFT_943559 [Mycena belliae]
MPPQYSSREAQKKKNRVEELRAREEMRARAQARHGVPLALARRATPHIPRVARAQARRGVPLATPLIPRAIVAVARVIAPLPTPPPPTPGPAPEQEDAWKAADNRWFKTDPDAWFDHYAPPRWSPSDDEACEDVHVQDQNEACTLSADVVSRARIRAALKEAALEEAARERVELEAMRHMESKGQGAEI